MNVIGTNGSVKFSESDTPFVQKEVFATLFVCLFVCRAGNLEVVKCLVEHGCRTNISDYDGTTPFNIASRYVF